MVTERGLGSGDGGCLLRRPCAPGFRAESGEERVPRTQPARKGGGARAPLPLPVLGSRDYEQSKGEIQD